MEVLETVKKQELVEKFAEHIAYSQEKADKYYYVLENHEESDYITHKITALGICYFISIFILKPCIAT